jgi:hypothetical protein
VAARKVLQWSYVIGYYLLASQGAKEKALFEHQQEMLAGTTEDLQVLGFACMCRCASASACMRPLTALHLPGLPACLPACMHACLPASWCAREQDVLETHQTDFRRLAASKNETVNKTGSVCLSVCACVRFFSFFFFFLVKQPLPLGAARWCSNQSASASSAFPF